MSFPEPWVICVYVCVVIYLYLSINIYRDKKADSAEVRDGEIDAHVAEKASVSFKSALEDLLDLGFDRLYYYIERKPYFTEIEV